MRGSIRKRLTLVFVVLSIGPLVLVGIILAWQSFTTQKQQALNLQREVAQNVSSHVKAFLDGLESELRIVSQVQGLQKLDRKGQHDVLAGLLAHEDAFESLILLDGQGREQVRLARSSALPTVPVNHAKADEFVIPQTSGQTYYSPIHFNETTGEPFVTIAVPLFDLHTGLVDGVLVSEVRLKRIWDLIMNLQIGPGQSVYIVDAQQKVVAHQNPSVVLRGTTFHVPDQDGIYPGLTGSSVVLSVNKVRFGGQELNIIAEQTVTEALALAINTILIITSLMVGALVISVALGLVIVRQIVHPIQAMATTAEAISAGDLSRQVQVTSRDEVGVLAAAFNSMTAQLRQSLQDLEQEVVEVRQAEEALRESEERLRQIASSLREVIWLRDTQTRQVLYVNPAFETLTGWSCESFYKDPDIVLNSIHPEDKEAVIKQLEQRSETIHYNIEHRIIHRDGSARWISSRSFPVRNEAGKIFRWASIMEDITARKHAEDEILRLNAELEQRVVERTAQLQAANKELEAFSYSVSHDLRAPLRSINGFSQAILEDYANLLDAEGKGYLQNVLSASLRMEQLINDMLGLSRITRSEMYRATVDLSALAKSIAAELQTGNLQRRVEFIIQPELIVNADPNLMRIVLENLLGNAWKFTSKHPAARIEIGMMQQEGHGVYFVRDDGDGFDMTYAGKLFGAFQRLHSAADFEGTGVGLTIVQRIIHRHGGEVWAEAAPGKGATFYFTLM